MVTRIVIAALVLTGCLFKPERQSGSSDGGIDGDATDATDGSIDVPPSQPPCASGVNAWPADFHIDGPPRVFDYNHDQRDDFLIYGSIGTPSTQSAVYVVVGRDVVDLDCYDAAFSFSPNAGEVIETWVGDLTGDSLADLVLFGRDESASAYRLRLFPGLATGFSTSGQGAVALFSEGPLSSMAKLTFPRWVAGVTKNGLGHIVFGGLYKNYGGFDVTAAGALVGPYVVVDDGTGAGLTIEAAGEMSVQHVWPQIGPSPRLLAATQAGVRAADYVLSAGNSMRFTLLPESSGTDRFEFANQRFVRVWHRPFEGGRTLAAVNDFDYQIVSYGAADGFKIFEVPATGDTLNRKQDLAFGRLGGTDPSLDLIALSVDDTPSMVSRLSVHPDLNLDGVGQIDPNSRLRVDNTFGDYIVVGDFSQDTPGDEILLLDSTVQTTLGTCYRVLEAGARCLAPCGATSCP